MRFARVKALVIKELLAVLRDRKSRTVLILPPLLQLTIFAFAATMEVKNIELGVLDKDGGKAAVELVQRFSGSPSFTRVFRLSGQAEVAPTIEGEKAMSPSKVPPRERLSRALWKASGLVMAVPSSAMMSSGWLLA